MTRVEWVRERNMEGKSERHWGPDSIRHSRTLVFTIGRFVNREVWWSGLFLGLFWLLFWEKQKDKLGSYNISIMQKKMRVSWRVVEVVNNYLNLDVFAGIADRIYWWLDLVFERKDDSNIFGLRCVLHILGWGRPWVE